jgi:DNA-binding transcriptional regulator LsrR (DeoR family)
MAEVARLYYVRDLTQQQIAARLGISRFKVLRLLDQARAEGVVRFEIDEPIPVLDDLSSRLEQLYELETAVVVERDIAGAAAHLLPRLLRGNDVLGVAWGATLQLVAEQLPALGTRTPVVQICGAMPGLQHGTGPTELAARFAQRTGGPFHPLPAPALASRRARDELLAHDAVRRAVRMFRHVTLALVGIGVRPGGGHLLVHVFGEDGRLRKPELAVAMTADELRRARTFAVAGGAPKRGAVRGALQSGLLAGIVTDERCARWALR